MGKIVRIDAAGELPPDDERFSERAFGHLIFGNAKEHGYHAQLEELDQYMLHYPSDRRHLHAEIERSVLDEEYPYALYALDYRRRQIGDEWSVESRDREEVAGVAHQISILASLQHDETTQNLAERMLRLVEGAKE